MTEDEAKTKWCPHTVASHTDPRAMAHHERPQLGLPTETFRHACIGSACMAWRTTPVQEHEAENDEDAAPYVEAGWRKGIRARDGQFVVIRGGEGFCGLAGRPA